MTARHRADPVDHQFGRVPGDVIILRFPDGSYAPGTEFEIVSIWVGPGPTRYVVRRYGNHGGMTSTILADKFERN